MLATVSPQEWNLYVASQPRAHVLQDHAWGQLKSAFGWQATQIIRRDDAGSLIAGTQILYRDLPLRLGTMAYLPMAPYGAADDRAALWAAIHAENRRRNARFLKWEPGIVHAQDVFPEPETLGFVESVQTIQPPRTIIIDLTPDLDDILMAMSQSTRRKVRQGEKKGVRFFRGTLEDIPRFTRMMQTTGNRNEFGVHDADYYRAAFELFGDDVALFMAEHEGDDLAGIMVFSKGPGAWYLYGASASVKRNLMATYGVQWQAIQWAKTERGCTYYDLWGVPDADEKTLEAGFQTRNDGLWGVYGFKRGWGGHVLRSLGAWDYVYQPIIYTAYKMALKVRGDA
jgi:peptidoglycan pentaglycine glycine transferase (the first glycine)